MTPSPSVGDKWMHNGVLFQLVERINPQDDKCPSFKIKVLSGQCNWDWVQFGPGVIHTWEK